jgi:hypothetical protein
MPTNARFAKASLWVNPDSLKKFFAGHRKYLTVFISVSKPQQAGSVSPTKFFGKMPKPGRRGDRSNASTQRGGYSFVFA